MRKPHTGYVDAPRHGSGGCCWRIPMPCRVGGGPLPRRLWCSAAQITPRTPQTRRPSDKWRGKAAPTRQSATMRAAEHDHPRGKAAPEPTPPTTRPETPIRARLRDRLHTLVDDALASARIPPSLTVRSDTGDGLWLLADAQVPTMRLLHPLATSLATSLASGLGSDNRRAAAAAGRRSRPPRRAGRLPRRRPGAGGLRRGQLRPVDLREATKLLQLLIGGQVTGRHRESASDQAPSKHRQATRPPTDTPEPDDQHRGQALIVVSYAASYGLAWRGGRLRMTDRLASEASGSFDYRRHLKQFVIATDPPHERGSHR